MSLVFTWYQFWLLIMRGRFRSEGGSDPTGTWVDIRRPWVSSLSANAFSSDDLATFVIHTIRIPAIGAVDQLI